MWRVLTQRLAVGDKFLKLGILGDPLYAHCEKDIETMEHLFLHCESTRILWSWVNLSFGILVPQVLIEELWFFLFKLSPPIKFLLSAAVQLTIYYLWKARNSLRFQAVNLTPEVILKKIQHWFYIYSFVGKNIMDSTAVDILEKLNILNRDTIQSKSGVFRIIQVMF